MAVIRRRDPGKPLTDGALLIVYAHLVLTGAVQLWAAVVILGTELWDRALVAAQVLGIA